MQYIRYINMHIIYTSHGIESGPRLRDDSVGSSATKKQIEDRWSLRKWSGAAACRKFPTIWYYTLTQLLLLSCKEITVDSAIINKCADSAVKKQGLVHSAVKKNWLSCKEIYWLSCKVILQEESVQFNAGFEKHMQMGSSPSVHGQLFQLIPLAHFDFAQCQGPPVESAVNGHNICLPFSTTAIPNRSGSIDFPVPLNCSQK